MKTVGIIGGMGPDTTIEFYRKLVSCDASLKQATRPSVLISSVPLDYALEREVIVNSRRMSEYLPILVKAAQGLERGGADFLVMPCCSLHLFIEQLRQAVNIPMLSVIEEVGQFFQKEKAGKVAVLGTKVTASHQLFSVTLGRQGIEEEYPSSEEQEELSEHIHQLVLSGSSSKAGVFLKNLLRDLSSRGATHTLLACTDLQLVIDPNLHFPRIVDSLDLLLSAVKRELFPTHLVK